jgi:hypothetical protein
MVPASGLADGRRIGDWVNPQPVGAGHAMGLMQFLRHVRAHRHRARRPGRPLGGGRAGLPRLQPDHRAALGHIRPALRGLAGTRPWWGSWSGRGRDDPRRTAPTSHNVWGRHILRTTGSTDVQQTGEMNPSRSGPARRYPLAIAIGLLMVAATLSLAIASVLHFGVAVPLGAITITDPFRGAAIPEAVLAVVLGIGVVSVLTGWSAAWWVALATTLFALLGTLYGLTVTLRRGEIGDIAYHLSLLTLLIAAVALLLAPAGRRALSTNLGDPQA